ncbi:MAG: dephospho-CoA kinase [Pyrinomonadaceae bacterium]
MQPNNSLDRRKLGSIVFSDPDQRLLLNRILHPLIIAAQDEEMRRVALSEPHGVCIVDAALMIESGGFRRFDTLIVVHCRDEIQLTRLIQRESITNDEARRRIAAQMPQEEKKRYANYLIDTSDGYQAARQQTIAVFGGLKALSATRLDAVGP